MARTKKDRPALTGPVPHQGTTPHTQEDTMTGTPTITIPGRRLYDDALREQDREELLDAVGAVFARAYGSE